MRPKRYASLMLLALAIAVCASAAQSGKAFLANLQFKTNPEKRQAETREITGIVNQYNKSTARYYSSAGEKEVILSIPAAPLLKRRLVADVTMLQRASLAMVFDRDSEKIESVKFLAPDVAVVVTREVWAMALQESHTRQPLSTVKAAEVQARYLLHKEPFGDVPLMWVVYEADVYPKDAVVPDFITGPVL